MADTTTVLEERGGNYGKFIDNAEISQYLKEYMRNQASWNNLDPDQREALDNMAIKFSRILSDGSSRNYADNWVDIAGYAQLVSDRLNGVIR